MSPRRWPVRAKTIGAVHAGLDGAGHPFRFFLTFTDAGGLASARGREVRAMLDGYEVAGVLHAIPSSLIADDADRQALVRVTCLLSRLARNSHD